MLYDYLSTRASRVGDCLLLKNKPNTYGYPQVTKDMLLFKQYNETLLHRIVWTHHNGIIPDGMVIMHTCDVRNCVDIKHLQLGTPRDNWLDCIAKGRNNTIRGESVSNAKLDNNKVLLIRELQGEFSAVFLAELFNIHVRHIYSIWRREVWRHI